MRAVLSREEKGRLIAEQANQVQQLDERSYKVASQNGHGMYDVVRRENGSWICDCLDFHYRNIFHNYIRPHEALKGKTPSEVAGIEVEGENKWITLIQNARKEQVKDSV